jgi:hypothetical protein
MFHKKAATGWAETRSCDFLSAGASVGGDG